MLNDLYISWFFLVGMLKVASGGNLGGFGFSKTVVNFSVIFLGNGNNFIFAYNSNTNGGLPVLGFVVANGIATLNKSLNYILYYIIIY